MGALPRLRPFPTGMWDGRGPYRGPGDLTSGWLAWWGLQGFSHAVVATGTQNAITVRRASDNTTSNILILRTGLLDIATMAAFTPVDATGIGAITGTTLTFTGGHIGDVVTGGTVLPGTYIVSGSSPSWTVNQTQTVVSATLTLTWGVFVTKWFDQSGAGKDVSNATSAQQAQIFTTGGPAGGPSVLFTGSASQGYVAATTLSNGSWSMSMVAKRTGAFTTIGPIFGGGIANWSMGFANAANQVYGFAGSLQTAAATDNAWHAVNDTFNGATSTLYVDGSATALNPGTSPMSDTPEFGSHRSSSQFLTGAVTEGGINSNLFNTGGIQASVNSNQHTRYAF